MAAKYRKIDPRVWTDEGFIELDAVDKLVALYVITAQSNRCGLFQFSSAKAAEETGLDADSYAGSFGKVCDTLNWKYDLKRRVIYLPTWWKYNPPENPKHLLGCLDDLRDLPHSQLLAEFAKNDTFIPTHCRKDFSIAMQIAIANQEQKQEQERKKKSSAGAESARADPAAGAAVARAGAGDSVAAPAPRHRKLPSGPHHELIRFFCDAWRGRYGAAYAFKGDREGRHIKWILSALQSELAGSTDTQMLEAAKALVSRYIGDEDQWLIDHCHPLGQLVSRFNMYRVGAQPRADQEKTKNGTSDQHVVRRGGSAPGGDQFIGARRKLPEVVAGAVGGAGGGGGGSHERGAG